MLAARAAGASARDLRRRIENREPVQSPALRHRHACRLIDPGYQHAAVWPAAPLGRGATSSSAQRSRARGQRGWKRQPPGRREASATSPFSRPRGRSKPAARACWAPRRRAPACTGAAAARARPPQLPSSIDAPEVHHRDAVAERPGSADVVRDQEQRQPACAAQAEQKVEHLGAYGDVERRDRLVAHEPCGLRCERARNRDALALPARELERIAVPEALRGRESRVLERVRARAGPLGPRDMLCMCSGSCTSSLTCMRGLSDWYGSWNTICSFSRSVRRPPRSSGAPSKRSSPPLGCSRPSSVRASVVLPQPDSPTTPSTSFRRHSRSTPSSARTARPRTAQLDLESACLGQRRDGGGERVTLIAGSPRPRSACSGANRHADSWSSPTRPQAPSRRARRPRARDGSAGGSGSRRADPPGRAASPGSPAGALRSRPICGNAPSSRCV